MLLRYIVSNYKSIGHPVEFSMLPLSNEIEDKYIRKIETCMGEWKVLRRGCFYGPNASGKSSFVESLAFVSRFVVEGVRSGTGIEIDQFRGDFEDLEQKSNFQLLFYVDGDVFSYGFTLDTEQVYEEQLVRLSPSGFLPLFTRTTSEDRKTDIRLGFSLTSTEDEKQLAELLTRSMKEEQRNQLFLFKLYDNGFERMNPIMKWFRSLVPIFPSSTILSLPLLIDKHPSLHSFLQDSLKNLDTGISDVKIQEKTLENGQRMKKCIFHHNLNGKSIPLGIKNESDGTKRLLTLLPVLFQAKEKFNTIFIIDELDRSLHTKLSQYFLDYFLNLDRNNSAQIICTSHDVNLIDLKRFAPEEIWFIEKNASGESKLRPLSDFDIKEGQNALKSYLNGRFGAIPFIEEGI